jgi:hypothetical protein
MTVVEIDALRWDDIRAWLIENIKHSRISYGALTAFDENDNVIWVVSGGLVYDEHGCRPATMKFRYKKDATIFALRWL